MKENRKQGTQASGKNKFMSMFKLVEDGKLKSTYLLYAFSISFVFLVVYVVSYMLLLKPLDQWLTGRMSTFAINCIESILPALLGTVLCMLPQAVAKNKRLIPGAYVFLLIYAVALLGGILLIPDAQERSTFLTVYAMSIPAPVLLGNVCAFASLAWFDKKNRA